MIPTTIPTRVMAHTRAVQAIRVTPAVVIGISQIRLTLRMWIAASLIGPTHTAIIGYAMVRATVGWAGTSARQTYPTIMKLQACFITVHANMLPPRM